MAEEKRAAFADQEYWGRPVPGFGDSDARVLIVGLAPAAHGANRTGRMFTGDRSGDWLYRALHRAGLANRPTAVSRDDGLRLDGAYVTAVVRCAPPGNQPLPSERRNCRPYLERELDLLPDVRVIVALGAYAYRHALRVLRDRGIDVPSPMPDFRHGLEVPLHAPGTSAASGGGSEETRLKMAEGEARGWPWRSDRAWVLASYHPSQQNTFTGTLTEAMFDEIWTHARELERLGGDRG